MTSYSFSTNFTKLTTVSLLLQSKTQTKLLTISAVNHAKVKTTKAIYIYMTVPTTEVIDRFTKPF